MRAAALWMLSTPALAQQDGISLKGAIDIHVHQDPDSAPRAIDADDVARQAKAAGMRAVVLKNHWEDTASLAYMVRKIVPGFEAFGGITQDLAVGGINIEAARHMADMKGGYGRIVWLPTFDAQNQVKDKGPEVKVSDNGKLLPSVLALLDYIATRKQLALETGHVSAEEALMVIREARTRGIQHVVATHGLTGPTNPTNTNAIAISRFIVTPYRLNQSSRASHEAQTSGLLWSPQRTQNKMRRTLVDSRNSFVKRISPRFDELMRQPPSEQIQLVSEVGRNDRRRYS